MRGEVSPSNITFLSPPFAIPAGRRERGREGSERVRGDGCVPYSSHVRDSFRVWHRIELEICGRAIWYSIQGILNGRNFKFSDFESHHFHFVVRTSTCDGKTNVCWISQGVISYEFHYATRTTNDFKGFSFRKHFTELGRDREEWDDHEWISCHLWNLKQETCQHRFVRAAVGSTSSNEMDAYQ